MVNNQHTWNSTPSSLLPGIQQTKHLFKHQFSGKILLADKSDDHVFYHRLSNFVTAAAWYEHLCKANGMTRTIIFPFKRRREKVIVCIFGHGFLSSCTTIVLGIANYPSICISCRSNDLSLHVVTVLRSLKSEIRECIIPRTNFCLYLAQVAYICSKPVLTKYLLWQCQVFAKKISLKFRLFSIARRLFQN